ncbi:MAG: RNA polymerase sigma factor [Bacteroidales bacterium]|nr:RNA polymerase sigma factor [Bacteroidales bacterium]
MEHKRILELYKAGDHNQAFNLLVRQSSQPLYWHIRRIVLDHDDANDLLQNTYIKAWGALDTFREDSKLYTWLFRIATNEVLNFLRKKRIINFLSFGDDSQNFENKLASDPSFSGDKADIALHKAISLLPARQKVIFCMRYFDEKRYDEISDILEITEGAAKASYHHARNKITSYLKEELDLGD